MTEENASSGGLVCGCARSVMLDAKPFHSSITGKWQQKKECLEIKFLSSDGWPTNKLMYSANR